MMRNWEIGLIVGMLLATFGVRYLSLALVGNFEMPAMLRRALGFVPVAVLTAIIVPAALMPGGTLDLGFGNAYLWAGLVSTVVAWRFANVLVTIVVGLVVFVTWNLTLG